MTRNQVTLAGRLERVIAFIIDRVILFLPNALLVMTFGTEGLVAVAGFCIDLFYFTWFLGSRWQASPGQRFLKIHVIHANGTPLSLPNALERSLAFTLPTLPIYASFLSPQIAQPLTLWLLAVWLVPILVRNERTGVHDMLCRTRVVNGVVGIV